MKKRVFILNGGAGVGKDTFCNILKEYVPLVHFSSIRTVKEIAKKCGWNGVKTEQDRKFLSDLKSLLTKYNDLPFKNLQSIYSDFMKDDIVDVLIADIREPEEIKRAVKEFGAKTILIENKNVRPITSNLSDAGVNNYIYDYIIKNNGTLEDFKAQVKFFAETLLEVKNTGGKNNEQSIRQ